MKNKRMAINLIASIFSLFVNIIISFFLTPFIVGKIGKEANGFIVLANNFVGYASIITVALNSIAGRFISVKIHEKDEEGANEYFNSVIAANAIISIVLGIISIFTVVYLENLIDIPSNLLFDVKVTFALVFLGAILSIMTSIFNVATFVRNRLDLSSIRNIQSNLIRGITMLALFYFLEPRVFYVSITMLIMKIFYAIKNYEYLKRLLPEVKFNLKKATGKAVKEMLSLGVWNSVNQLNTVLLSGLDLLIANVFIGAADMGTISIAKTIPNVFETFIATIGGIFSPNFTMLYAEGKHDELIKEIKLSMKILGLIATVPLVGFAVFGTEFYSLWLPNESYETIIKIQTLSLLEIAPKFASIYIFTLYNINTITKKLKVPVLLTLGISFMSTILVIILLKTTNLGVYAIVGVSSVLLIIRVITFLPTYAAHNLNVKLTTFYKPLIRGMLSLVVVGSVFIVIRTVVTINSWIDLALVAIGAGVLGYIINFFLILNQSERKIIFAKFKSKIKFN